MTDSFLLATLQWASRKWDLEATKLGSIADEKRKELFLLAWSRYVLAFLAGDIILEEFALCHRLLHQTSDDFVQMMNTSS
jgi:uncharacterized membrane protein YidH (DUF202 family)